LEVAYASWIENTDNVKTKPAKIKRYDNLCVVCETM